MTFASLFAGIGGFDLGLERAGMTCLSQCEINPQALRVLRRHWPAIPKIESVDDFHADGTIQPDLLCGGFPCQDLSVAGQRAGLAGKRSGLFWEFVRIIDELSPSWILIENVPGLLSSQGGRDMGAVLGALAELGYGTAYRVLDAQWFGLAQRRKRVFIVGCAGGAWRRAAEVLFERESLPWDSPPGRKAGEDVAHCLTACATASGRYDPSGETLIPFDLSGTTSPINRNNPTPGSIAYRTTGNSGCYATGDQVGALNTATDTCQHVIVCESAVRRLTPLEKERLQGFPDDWTAGESDSARGRLLGNAVAVPVAEWIGTRIAAKHC